MVVVVRMMVEVVVRIAVEVEMDVVMLGWW